MKSPDKFVIPGRLGIWRIIQREGPPHVWLAHRPDIGSSRVFSSPQDLIEWTAYPATPAPTQDLKDWITSFNAQETSPEQNDEFKQQINQEGFGPPPGHE